MPPLKILLITPPVIYSRQPPISTASLASFLKSRGLETKAWDLNTEIYIPNDADDNYWAQIENCRKFYENNKELFDKWTEKIFEYDPAIIGFTVWSTTLFFSLKLAMRIKRRDKSKIIVFGGYWSNVEAEEIFDNPQVDIIVKGEGEETLLEIAEQYEKKGRIESCRGCIVRNGGEVVDCGIRPEIRSLDTLPFPDFSDFNLESYLYKYHIPIVFSRGCSWHCSFCTTFRSWNKFRIRSAKNIYQEILFRLKQYPALRQFEICDPAFNQVPSVLLRLCDLIITGNLNVKFSGMAQIRPEMDFSVLKKIKNAGFRLLNYGIESGSQNVLDKMGKRYSVEQAQQVIRDTYNAGIDVVLNFIVGFPGEAEDDFYETLKFIERNRAYISNIAPAHECDIGFNALHHNSGRFGVVVPKIKEYTRFWETADAKNNHKERKRRKDIFDKFVTNLGIPLKCGIEDRKDYEFAS
jgi:radical SAM superfamily enzyme YgiQ (UPF0313 family)